MSLSDLDPKVTAAIISATVTLLISLFSYLRWRKDVKVKLGEIREAITEELIKQRIDPYSEFIERLEITSSIHKQEIVNDESYRQKVLKLFQDAIYGRIGLLASHETRHVLVSTRLATEAYINGQLDYEDWRTGVWATTLSLRNDLGIRQPDWDNALDKLREERYNFSHKTDSSEERWVSGAKIQNFYSKMDSISEKKPDDK